MKKLLTILLGLCFVVPAFAADVRNVNNDAWLEHMTQMQALRQQIMSHLTKSNPTFEDRDQLNALKSEFDYKKQAWDRYLQEVAQGNEPVPPVLAKKASGCDHKHGEACKEHKHDRKHKHSHKKHACGEHKHKHCDHKIAADCCGKPGCKDKTCKSKKCGPKVSKCKTAGHKCNDHKIKADCCGKPGCKDKTCKSKKCGSKVSKCKTAGHKCNDHKIKADCCGGKDCTGHDKTGKCCKETGKTVKSAKCCN